jgi:hypothetical protein
MQPQQHEPQLQQPQHEQLQQQDKKEGKEEQQQQHGTPVKRGLASMCRSPSDELVSPISKVLVTGGAAGRKERARVLHENALRMRGTAEQAPAQARTQAPAASSAAQAPARPAVASASPSKLPAPVPALGTSGSGAAVPCTPPKSGAGAGAPSRRLLSGSLSAQKTLFLPYRSPTDNFSSPASRSLAHRGGAARGVRRDYENEHAPVFLLRRGSSGLSNVSNVLGNSSLDGSKLAKKAVTGAQRVRSVGLSALSPLPVNVAPKQN